MTRRLTIQPNQRRKPKRSRLEPGRRPRRRPAGRANRADAPPPSLHTATGNDTRLIRRKGESIGLMGSLVHVDVLSTLALDKMRKTITPGTWLSHCF